MYFTVYPNLNRELFDRKLTVNELIELTDLKYSTMIQKFSKGRNLKVDEAKKLKKALNTDMSIDELFMTEEEYDKALS